MELRKHYGTTRYKRLWAEMLITSKPELKKMMEDGMTDEQIIEQEKEKNRNYKLFKRRDYRKEEENYGNSYDTALPQDTGVF